MTHEPLILTRVVTQGRVEHRAQCVGCTWAGAVRIHNAAALTDGHLHEVGCAPAGGTLLKP